MKQDSLIGKQLGYWKVLEQLDNRHYTCECTLCKKQFNVQSYKLKNGMSKGCVQCANKLRAESTREKLEGTQINDWFVLEYIGNGQYKCKCNCGNIQIIQASQLKGNKTHRCARCNAKLSSEATREKLEGTQVGNLEVLEYLGNARYRCKCSCGNFYEASAYRLKNKETTMCLECSNILRKSKYRETMYNKYNEISSTISNMNSEIKNLIESYSYNVIYNDNKIIYPETLDIYISDIRLAIAVHDTYNYCIGKRNAIRNQQQTIACAKQGIQLIHIFEYEWRDDIKREKIIELLKSKLDAAYKTKIYARNTILKTIDTEMAREFCNKYHLQGQASSVINLGLVYNDELVSLMTFSRPRFNHQYQYELIRYVTKSDVAVIGGAKKLFKHFILQYDPESILSYCDITKFNGDIYPKLGFRATGEDITVPNYMWVNPKENMALPRYQTQKRKLVKLGLGDGNDTEDTIMIRLGYYKIYDSGNLRFSWYKEDNKDE